MEKLDETASVISAGKVTGTNVYTTDGEHLGEIQDVMIDKRSGKITYASCLLAVCSVLANGTIPYRGPRSSTTRGKVAMWSA